ncbi:hypothetical protein [Hymenobacter oligotrophus]|nr:hypothetical protein [Hymenobacter oligotrophus]
MAVVYGPVLFHPNQYLFNSAGDGVRGYYSIAYYIRYNFGTHFSGMQYPYGEHINYNDMQPLVSYPLAWVNQHLLPFDERILGVLNIISLASIGLTPVAVLGVCRRLGLPNWYAVPAALIIAFLSPQMARLDSHASMAHPAVLPLLWYWLLRSKDEPRRWRWYLAYALTALLSGLLHPYFLLMGSIITITFGGVFLAQQWRQRQQHYAWLLRLLTAAITPLVVYRVWLLLTDAVTDRPPNPWGLMHYYANFASVFLPVINPVRDALRHIFPWLPNPYAWEGESYVGALGLLVLVVAAVRLVRYVMRGHARLVLRPALPQGLRAALWASVLLLLWAMALPLRAPGGELLLPFLGPVKQLRALGRFAWYFYYVYTVYVAYYFYQLYRYLKQRRAQRFGVSVLLVAGAVAGFEALVNWQAQARPLRDRANAADLQAGQGNYREALRGIGRQPEDFQAILPLPYARFGTDKLQFDAPDRARYESFRASLDTKLPLLSAAMARTSIGQTLRLTEILGSPLVDKPLLRQLPNGKPFLLLVTPDELAAFEKRIVALGKPLVSTPRFSLYELPVAALAATDRAAALQYFQEHRLQLTAHPQQVYATTPRGVLLESYAGRASERAFLRPGAFTSPKGFATLYDGPLPAPADTGRYEVSVWIDARSQYGIGHIQAKLYDKQGNLLEHVVNDTRRSTEISGDWVRSAVVVHATPATTRLEVLYENDDLIADELLIRPLDTDVYTISNLGPHKQIAKNGYPIGNLPRL